MAEDDALEKAGRVKVFFAFGENFPGEMLLFIMLPSSLSWTLGPGVHVCVWGWAHRKQGRPCCSGLSIASLAAGLTSLSATGFHPFFLVTMNRVLALLEASLPPSFSPKSCKL